MLFLPLVTLLCGFAETAHGSSLLPNVNAAFGDSPASFNISVDRGFINGLRERVRRARLPVEVQSVSAGSDGPTIANVTSVQRFWVKDYDWETTEQSINSRFKQFTTTVQMPPQSNYSQDVPLHFVHHKSSRPDAIPLLFVHGWPGSFLEVENIIGFLTNPPNSSLPAFHVVAPSIPGFGFSPAPRYAGFGSEEAGHAFNALMHQLQYAKYVMQSGDFGAIIMRYQAVSYPQNLVSVLSNFWPVQPNATDLARYAANETTTDETEYIARFNTFVDVESGYRIIQETQPLTIGYALTDSPLGFAMWIFSLMREAVDPHITIWTAQDIITWSLMYTIQGPYGGVRLYEEMLRECAFQGLGVGNLGGTPGSYFKQPVAISEFPYDIWYGLPLDWAQRGGNAKVRYMHDRGGHFAAWEVPQLLADDIWGWFGDREVSGTKVFY
ncbi:hypothetical protein LTR36_005600 [Oleoguttula mirabilis]|uniref:Epoxide hydrolase N-terminal domain-containing protein n=1 Tax=Oleoguttula mirabilis TaxID=1507867 RepID=A0AAV9JE51_9PEZI|nr:hypothetical protein LTR36_005600 [Oleoguttula mirabilis]